MISPINDPIIEQFAFTIYGNQANPKGNPIPYHRATQKSFWNKGSKRYAAWKIYVRASAGMVAPRTIPEECYISTSMSILWANNAHGDADNVFKGIMDSIFENDKEVRHGEFSSMINPDGVGMVIVQCTLYREEGHAKEQIIHPVKKKRVSRQSIPSSR